MHCSKCGAELKEGANFCNQCGNPVVSETPEGQSAVNTEESAMAERKQDAVEPEPIAPDTEETASSRIEASMEKASIDDSDAADNEGAGDRAQSNRREAYEQSGPTQERREVVFCSRCGTPNPADSTHCVHCGEALASKHRAELNVNAVLDQISGIFGGMFTDPYGTLKRHVAGGSMQTNLILLGIKSVILGILSMIAAEPILSFLIRVSSFYGQYPNFMGHMDFVYIFFSAFLTSAVIDAVAVLAFTVTGKIFRSQTPWMTWLGVVTIGGIWSVAGFLLLALFSILHLFTFVFFAFVLMISLINILQVRAFVDYSKLKEPALTYGMAVVTLFEMVILYIVNMIQ